MLNTRASGVLMHLSSLPSPYAVGVMGDETKRFIDKIADMGFSYWQILPLNPPDFYGSPYTSNAVFAISHMFIDPRPLLAAGLVSQADVERNVYYGSPYTADYEFAYNGRLELLKKAFKNADGELLRKAEEFAEKHGWCKAYSLYEAAKERFDNRPWYEWDADFARYEKCVENEEALSESASFYAFVQYIAYSQWREIKLYANDRGVKILGDMPIYVSTDSVDVWSNRSLFEIDGKNFSKKRVAGVPPDYFSADGQLWGNPLYDWKSMEKDGFKWWIDRLKASLTIFDTVRIDHFRAFASYWAVPAKSETAREGEWLKGPGMKLFNAVREEMGDLPIIAEDLGTFGEDVIKLLENTAFPGMRVIQFGFDPGADSTHLPHNYPKNSIAYVGTHDNNTLLAWLWEASEQERKFALDYCSFKGDNWGEGGYHSPSCRAIIEAVWRSPSLVSMISFQDMCGFGSDARMNVPGRAFGNWQFRTTEDTIAQLDADYYRHINYLFKRK
ncbi:MAG: 4-alpha-glucanotransferase [Clostridia bacterium]|nr:4-alpha-glucanotransferase [Clostridia bacterium]